MNIPPPGTHLISNNNTNTPVRGKILEIIKQPFYIIIEWDEPIGEILYTESMIKECLSLNIISIDKQYYRNQKINQILNQII
jgi:hypothetical protein